MSYGLSEKGINIKRYDEINEEIHSDLSASWGINTRNNPKSFLGHLIANLSDKLAQLWEFGEQVYYSQYPSSAEGISLDYAAQYGGSVRKEAAPSRYPIHCKGIDGTNLAVGTLIKSDTNPAVELSLITDATLTRNECNSLAVKVAAIESNAKYFVEINKEVFSISTGENPTALDILNALKNRMLGDDESNLPGIINFTVSVDEENELLIIEADDLSTSNVVSMSENLTTEYVVCVITFYTKEKGDIVLPNGTITKIVQADSGLVEIDNKIGYIAGREIETDTEFRNSYIDKIFNLSTSMCESIRSHILENVQGVSSVACYENPSHEWDNFGRPPHCVEVVVEGGDSYEIAKQIFDNKAGGIATYADNKGRVTVIVPGKYDEPVTIFFGRPEKVYVYYHLEITVPDASKYPNNGNKLLSDTIIEYMNNLNPGDDVIPVQFISRLYENCSGVTDVEISLFTTTDILLEPEEYKERTREITARQLATTTENMIKITRKINEDVTV